MFACDTTLLPTREGALALSSMHAAVNSQRSIWTVVADAPVHTVDLILGVADLRFQWFKILIAMFPRLLPLSEAH